jgi:hypothetical protein
MSTMFARPVYNLKVNTARFVLSTRPKRPFISLGFSPLSMVSRKRRIASTLGICDRYAYEIARGKKLPHRRHWLKLAELVRVTSD